MRLSPKEAKAITRAFAICLPALPYSLYLFGSRTDDNKRGGDIDLLVVVPTSSKTLAVELKTKIRNEIFSRIPEQKIDITVATPEESLEDIFLKSVLPEALLLAEHLPAQQ